MLTSSRSEGVSLPTVADWMRSQGVSVVDPGLRTGNSTYFNLERRFPELYFGWPYPPPPTVPDAAGFYQCSGATLPRRERVVVHSPLRLLVTSADGRSLGVSRSGRSAHSLAGFYVVPPDGGPQLYEFAPGNDRVTLTATGTGAATIVAYPPSTSLGTPDVFAFPVRRGQTGTLTVGPRGPTGKLRFAGRSYRAVRGIALRLTGLPRRLGRRPARVRLVVRDQFGQPVAGAVVSVAGRRLASTVTADASGTASITLPAKGSTVRARISALGYRTLTITLQ